MKRELILQTRDLSDDAATVNLRAFIDLTGSAQNQAERLRAFIESRSRKWGQIFTEETCLGAIFNGAESVEEGMWTMHDIILN